MNTPATPPDPCGPAAVAALLEQLAARVDQLLILAQGSPAAVHSLRSVDQQISRGPRGIGSL